MRCWRGGAHQEASLQETKGATRGGGNIFDKIGSWFSDRKDDAGDAAEKAKNKAKN